MGILTLAEKERALKVLELIFDYLPPAAQIEVKDLTKLINSPETEQDKKVDSEFLRNFIQRSVRKLSPTNQTVLHNAIQKGSAAKSTDNMGALHMGSDAETIVLEKVPGQSLGFNVVGKHEEGYLGVYVNKINPGGAAHTDSRLKEGDEIVAINGEPIHRNNGTKGIQAFLQKISTLEGPISLNIIRSKPSAPIRPSLLSRKLIIAENSLLVKPVTVDLMNEGGGLGFGIVDTSCGSVVIKTIVTDGPAFNEGTLRTQDVILEINDARVGGMSQQDVAKILQTASPNISMVVGRPVLQEVKRTNADPSSFSATPLTFCPDTGGLVVQSVNELSCLNKGDKILEMNGVSIDLKSPDKIAAALAEDAVSLAYIKCSDDQCSDGLPDYDGIDDSLELVSSLGAIRVGEDLQEMSAWCERVDSVEVDKGKEGLGISIIDCKDPFKPARSVIVIEEICEGSVLSNLVQVGSRLVRVNDTHLGSSALEVAVTVLKMTPPGVVRLGISPRRPCPSELTDLNPISISICNNATVPGVTLVPITHEKITGFEVCSIIEDGLIAQDGRLKTGDIILTVNHALISHFQLHQVRELLQMSCESSTPLRVSYIEKQSAAYTVSVTRNPKTGIGICIVGGAKESDPRHGVFIRKIIAQNSDLKIGEQILKVNDVSMEGKSHSEAVEVLKTASSPLLLTLLSPYTPGDEESAEINVTVPRQPGGLGMDIGTVAAGIVVVGVSERGPAAGILAPGDTITKVNGVALKGMPQDMMLPLIQQQDDPLSLTVVRKPPRTSLVTPASSTPSSPLVHKAASTEPRIADITSVTISQPVHTVMVRKKENTIGINIIQKPNQGIFVKNIVEDSPAAEVTNLKPGDQILAVNGQALPASMSRIKAIAVLRKTEGEVTLLITRPHNRLSAPLGKENSPKQQEVDRSAYKDLVKESETDTKSVAESNVINLNLDEPSGDIEEGDSISRHSLESKENRRSGHSFTKSNSNRSSIISNNSEDRRSRHSTEPDVLLDEGVTPTGSCHSYTSTHSVRSTTFTYEKTSPQLSRQGSSKQYTPRPSSDSRQEPLSRAEPLSRRSIESLSSLSSYQSNVSSRRTPTESDVVKVTLNCSRESSGITLGPNPQSMGVLVKSIAKNSPASQKIWPQDLILEVEVEGRRYTQVSNITDQLNCNNCTVDVLVQRECPIYDEFCVKLEKPETGGLGLSINERRSIAGIYISIIAPGGPASLTRLLKKGQRLLAVNGASVKYRRQGDVVEMLKDITEVVELTVGLAKRMEEYSSVSRNSQRGSVSGSHQGSVRGAMYRDSPSLSGSTASFRDNHSVRSRTSEGRQNLEKRKSEPIRSSNLEASAHSLRDASSTRSLQDASTCSLNGTRTAQIFREGDTPLGLSVAGGRGSPLGTIPLFISYLQPNGLAASTGLLRKGDRILSINGHSVENVSHEEAVTLLREAVNPVTLVLTDPQLPPVTAHRAELRVVQLTKGADGLGFSIVGGVGSATSLPVTVKKVYPAGSALGHLKRGDQILSVNGASLENHTHDEATKLLKAVTDKVTLVVR